MHIKGKNSWAKHLDFIIVDLIALVISFVLAYLIKFHNLSLGSEWKRVIVIIALISVIITLIVNPYSGIFRRRYYLEISKTFFIVIANALCTMLFFYVLKVGAEYSRIVIIYTYLFYFYISLVLKYIWKKILVSGKFTFGVPKKIPLFVVSSSRTLEKDIHSIYSTDLLLYDIKGLHLVDRKELKKEEPLSDVYIDENGNTIPIMGDSFVEFVLKNNINEVLYTVRSNSIDDKACKELVENGVGVNFSIESLMGFQTEDQYVSNIGVHRALSIHTFSFSPSQSFYFIIKRLFDIIIGLIGMIVLIPVTALVKIVYLVSGDNAKIFYRQKRVGLNGKLIKIWKFRSMVPDADKVLQELLKNDNYRKEWEENQKFENDPRITKVGAILRKTSIDELPQMINVFCGSMSLVGPRPLVEGELLFHDGLKLYERVKPGITGWWGCNGRSNIDYRERLELEYYYVKNCSLSLDVICIVRTILAILKKEGAK